MDLFYDRAVPGQLDGLGTVLTQTKLNNGGSSQQKITITIPANPDSNATYKIQLDPGAGSPTYTGFSEPNITVFYTTGDSATQTELAIGLIDAFHGSTWVPSSMLLDYLDTENPVAVDNINAPTTITLTSRFCGVNHTVKQVAAEGESLPTETLTISSTPGKKGLEIFFGRFVLQNGLMKSHEVSPAHAAAWTENPKILGAALVGITQSGYRDESRPTYETGKNAAICKATNSRIMWIEAAEKFKYSTATTDFYAHLDPADPEKNGCLTTISTDNQALPGLEILGDSQWVPRQAKYIVPVSFKF